MLTSTHNNKRRRIDTDIDTHPSLVSPLQQEKESIELNTDDSSAMPPLLPSCDVPSTTKLVEPRLDDIPHLLMVQLQNDSAPEVLMGLMQLYDLVGDSKDNAETAIQIGAPGMIVLTMKKWQHHETIQECCCSCLKRLAFITGGKDGRCAIALTGGVEAILNALQRFPHAVRVHLSGCGALMNVLFTGDTAPSSIQATSRRFVEELNGLSLIQEIMTRFPDDAHLQAYCCGILSNLSANKDYHEAMVKADVVTAVATALKVHLHDFDVKVLASKCLKRIISESGVQGGAV